MRCVLFLSAFCLFGWATTALCAADPAPWNDPFWTLLHEPAVIAELHLSPAQDREFHTLRDELDLRFLPLRNQPQEVALAGTTEITATARAKLGELLRPEQLQRYNELVLQRLGNGALLQSEVVERLACTKAQQEQIAKINQATDTAVAALRKEVQETVRDRQSAEAEYSRLLLDQQQQLLRVLTSAQQTTLKQMLGKPFAGLSVSQPHYRAPEFVDSGEWINSAPLSLQQLRGKVVVVHFYAFGCINCIRNYPWYREWSAQFRDQDVVIVGIHTPETNAERNSQSVRLKATEAGFDFPILIDAQQANWNAWGNSMWPSVYLIDKSGDFREHWAGELNWQGNEGEKFLRRRIEELLAESPR